MAIVYITEFTEMAVQPPGNVMPVGQHPAIAEQTVDFSGGENDSSAFNSATKFIRIKSDADCHVKIGDSPQTATTNSMPVKADQPEYFGVVGGHILSAVAAA